jgi:hypothetical protein
VAVCDGRVYFGCEDGYLYALGPCGQARLPEKDLGLNRIRSPLTSKLADEELLDPVGDGGYRGGEVGCADRVRGRVADGREGREELQSAHVRVGDARAAGTARREEIRRHRRVDHRHHPRVRQNLGWAQAAEVHRNPADVGHDDPVDRVGRSVQA